LSLPMSLGPARYPEGVRMQAVAKPVTGFDLVGSLFFGCFCECVRFLAIWCLAQGLRRPLAKRKAFLPPFEGGLGGVQ